MDAGITPLLNDFLMQEGSYKSISQLVDKSADSILVKAHIAGLTLRQYVTQDPDKAVKEAESCLNEWLKIHTMATLEGSIYTDASTCIRVDKNITALISSRVQLAKEQCAQVEEIAALCPRDSEQRRAHLARVLYDRAVRKGDIRAIEYLMNRIDGRPGEAKNIELDFDYMYNVNQVIHYLFGKQMEVLNSGSGTKLICGGRQSGKSVMLVALCLIECMRRPGITSLYIGETAELTERIIDNTANMIIDACHLRDKAGNRMNWKKFDNGSSILIRGLSNTKDPDQIRGHKAKVIVIDEFFHLKSDLLEYMHSEVLQPMQLTYADDYKFICCGTPPSIKGTYGEWAWKTWEVPHFNWNYKDCPYPVTVEQKETYITEKLKEKGLSWDSTYARREYLGEWCYDDDLLLYPEFHVYNPREGVPQWNVDMVLLGLDYGISDSDALVGIAWDTAGRRGYEFHEDKFSRLDIKDRTISQLEYLRGQVKIAWRKALDFFPTLSPREANKRILWDADDNNQHLTNDFNINCRLDDFPDLRLNIQNAHKTDRVLMFDKIRDLLRTADLLLLENGKVGKECQQTILRRGPGGQVYPDVDDKIFHPDLLPAMRYALWNVIGQETYKQPGGQR
jgi:hypothetical protein